MCLKSTNLATIVSHILCQSVTFSDHINPLERVFKGPAADKDKKEST